MRRLGGFKLCSGSSGRGSRVIHTEKLHTELVGHSRNSAFHRKGKGKPVKDFMQGSDMIKLASWKDKFLSSQRTAAEESFSFFALQIASSVRVQEAAPDLLSLSAAKVLISPMRSISLGCRRLSL